MDADQTVTEADDLRARIAKVRALHVWTPAGIKYRTNRHGIVIGTWEALWCGECQQTFESGGKCRVVALLDGDTDA